MLLDETVKLAQQQILADIASGVVPPTVSTFGELHDYVDANEYGGLCDMADQYRDQYDEVPESYWLFCGRVQDALHQWLVAGRGEVA